MNATAIVLAVIRVEAAVLVIVVATIVGYALVTRYSSRRRQVRLGRARAIVAAHLEQRELPADDLALLARLPRRDLIRLYFDISPSVGETERAWLRSLAEKLGLIVVARARTAATQWWKRLSGARLLTLIDAEPAIMQRLLADRAAQVRAQAAVFVATHPSADGIAGLIDMLADPAAICRFAAKDSLMRLGTHATATIVTHLAEPRGSRTIALLEVAAAAASHDYLPAATAQRMNPVPLARLLVARLLRGIGGPAASGHLVTLLNDVDASVREGAAEALGYLTHWPAAAAIARLLDDPDSSVRLAAAGALAQVGPPGVLFLRRAERHGSEYAAIAAARILDDTAR